MAPVRLLLLCAILACVQSVRFPERRDAIDDELDDSSKTEEPAVQNPRDPRHLGPGGFSGGLLDAAVVTVDESDPYRHRGRGRRPFPQEQFQYPQPSRDYELLVNLLVRNASSWDNVNGDPRRFQDRLAAMLGESKSESIFLVKFSQKTEAWTASKLNLLLYLKINYFKNPNFNIFYSTIVPRVIFSS